VAVGVRQVPRVHEAEVPGGFASACPPWAAAARWIASTASRLSIASESISALVPAGGNGRCVKVRHFACVTSINWIDSLHAMQADASSLIRGFCSKPKAL
jgi:hypothetical protein